MVDMCTTVTDIHVMDWYINFREGRYDFSDIGGHSVTVLFIVDSQWTVSSTNCTGRNQR